MVYGLFYNSISSLQCMALNSKMNWKGLGTGLGLTELLFQDLPGGIEENYRTRQEWCRDSDMKWQASKYKSETLLLEPNYLMMGQIRKEKTLLDTTAVTEKSMNDGD